MRAVVAAVLCLLGVAGGAQPQPSVAIRVDTNARKGLMHPFWAWYGHDEPNYTYTANGRKLLSSLQDLSPVPVFVRVHNLLTSGDGTPALKWGSTNIYTEDAGGTPVYDWTILDRIVDTYTARGMKPFVQLGFMPEALSSAPAGTPYRHFWKPGDSLNDIYTGWTYAPKDYRKWEELCYQVTHHLVEKYGRGAVESWWFEVWNEPDIRYWSGSVGPSAGGGDPRAAEKAQIRRDEYNKLYDFAVEGVRRGLSTARIGGPEVTGGAQAMLRTFLQHTSAGTNYATGKTGTPLDLITFHAKGSPTFVENRVRMRGRLRGLKRQRKQLGVRRRREPFPVTEAVHDARGALRRRIGAEQAIVDRQDIRVVRVRFRHLAGVVHLVDVRRDQYQREDAIESWPEADVRM